MKVYLYCTNEWDLATATDNKLDASKRIAHLSIMSKEYKSIPEWVLIGTAELSKVSWQSEKEVIQDAVDSIDAQIKNLQAETEMKINEFTRKKQELLAITMG